MGFQKIEYDAEGDVMVPRELDLMRAKPVASQTPPRDAGVWHAWALTPRSMRAAEAVAAAEEYLVREGALLYRQEQMLGAPGTTVFYYGFLDPSQTAAAQPAARPQIHR